MRLKRAVVGGEIYIAINNLLARFIRAFFNLNLIFLKANQLICYYCYDFKGR